MSNLAAAADNAEFLASGFEQALLAEAKFDPRATTSRSFVLEDIVADLVNGKTFTTIAENYKATAFNLLAWVERDPVRSARVREARAATAKLWDERAVEELREAGDAFSLAKAKELAHHFRWRASKIAPKEYGDRLDLNVTSQTAPPPLNLDALSPEEISVLERLLAKAQAPTLDRGAIDIMPVDVTALTQGDSKP